MVQNLIVLIIIAVVAVYSGYSLIKNISKKDSDGCSGCAGCTAKNELLKVKNSQSGGCCQEKVMKDSLHTDQHCINPVPFNPHFVAF